MCLKLKLDTKVLNLAALSKLAQLNSAPSKENLISFPIFVIFHKLELILYYVGTV